MNWPAVPLSVGNGKMSLTRIYCGGMHSRQIIPWTIAGEIKVRQIFHSTINICSI